MKSSILVKSLIGIGVAGGIAGGTTYALMPSSKHTITEELFKNKYTILTSDTTNRSDWDSIIISYIAITSTQNALKFDGLTGKESDAVSKLQNKCNELLKSSFDKTLDEKNYKKAEKWCVKPISISSILEKRGITVLNNDVSQKEANETEWKEKIDKHRLEQQLDKKLADISIGTNGTISDEHITSIKAKCNSMGKLKNHENKYYETLKSFELWCVSK